MSTNVDAETIDEELEIHLLKEETGEPIREDDGTPVIVTLEPRLHRSLREWHKQDKKQRSFDDWLQDYLLNALRKAAEKEGKKEE